MARKESSVVEMGPRPKGNSLHSQYFSFLVIVLVASTCRAFVVTPSSKATVKLSMVSNNVADDVNNVDVKTPKPTFDLGTALFCGGLAFDSYVEPQKNSSRWERGSMGMNVAFMSANYTRSLYSGLVQVQLMEITDLPDEDDTAEGLFSGGGVDAYLMVAAVEGQWEEDVALLQEQTYHDGVMGLLGAAHVGRSRTAWSNVDERKSQVAKRQYNLASPYHIPSSWGKGGQAIYPEEPPFYIYLQDPSNARLVFTVMDEDRLSADSPIGSAFRKLTDVIPDARLSQEQFVSQLTESVLQKIKKGNVDSIDIGKSSFEVKFGPKSWTGEIKLTSKPVKKDKNGQIAVGAAAGAVIAGPMGAAVGGFLGSMYEGEIRGRIKLRLRYLPFPDVQVERGVYTVKGGLPGVEWGTLYQKYLSRTSDDKIGGNDLEQCFFINHEQTGCSCSVYRSIEKNVIVVSFRGTCEPKDILTDASLLQNAWVEGEDTSEVEVAQVHLGFRKSMSSIARRLKELLLAAVAPGDNMSDYDMIVTGHSLGGALATLFVADIAEYGIDAGRALPQLEPSEPWWNSITAVFQGSKPASETAPLPPRPASLKLYNFGSPRVGNTAFCERFEKLQRDGRIDEAYRIVNGADVIARNPRTVIVPGVGNLGYDHCGATVLISPQEEGADVWVEGESDNASCPVRDSITGWASPLTKGFLLSDLVEATQKSLNKEDKPQLMSKLGKAAEEVTERLKKVSATDIASVAGFSRDFTEREVKIVQSLLSGQAIAHHMEDEYYGGMGRAAGFVARVGEEIEPENKEKESTAQ